MFEAFDGIHLRRCIAALAASEREDFDGLGVMDQLILYRWQDCLGHLTRDSSEIVWD